MKTENIRFHIMIPVYKVEDFLDECMESVLGQTYGNFDVLLADDGSPDRCGEMCDAWAAKDSRVRVIHKENEGLLRTRRFLIEQTVADGYGVFVDSDDFFLTPNALETVAEAIEKHGCDCVVYGARRMVDGKPGEPQRNISETTVVLRDKRQLYRHAVLDTLGNFYALWRKAVRMDALKNGMDYTPYYRLSLYEDRLQSLDIYRNCESFCFIPDILYGYRLNLSSITGSPDTYEKFPSDYTIQEAEAEFLRQENVFTEEDWAAYHDRIVHELAWNVLRAANLDTSRENRLALLEKIWSSKFAQDNLRGSYDRAMLGKSVVVYELFRRKMFRLLLLTAGLHKNVYMRLRALLRK